MAHRIMSKNKSAIKPRPDPIKRKKSELVVEKIVEPEPEKIIDPDKNERYCAEPGCGLLKHRGSYCEHHAAIYYVKPKIKDEEPQEFHSGYEKARRNF